MRVWRRFGPLLAIVLIFTPLLALAPISLPPDRGVQEADAAPDLRLPWDESENGQWTMTQGPHSPLTGGPTSGLDFARGYNNPSPVLSMFKGRVSKVGYQDQAYCGNPGNSVVEVTSDDGSWKVQYLHITDFGHVKMDQPIQQGDYIGKTGKVGCAGGVHVHLELFINGNRSSWSGRTIDGWLVGSSSQPHSSNARGVSGPSCPSQPLQIVEPLVIEPSTFSVGQQATASFAVRNISPGGCPTYNAVWIGAGGRGPNSAITDFPLKNNVKIAPGETWRYKESASFSPAGAYAFFIYVQDLKLANPSGLTQTVSRDVAACSDRPLKVTSAVTIDKTKVNLGESATAKFTVTNTAPAECAAKTFKWIGAGGRGPGGDPDVQDFPLKQNVTIAPGESYTYTASRTFRKPGRHSYWAAVQDQADNWYTVASSNTVTVEVADCAPRPVVASNIVISPSSPVAGEVVTASYTITNAGCAPFAPESIGVAARDIDNQEANYDFGPWVEGVVLQPGESRTITVSRTFDAPGGYRLWVSYRDADLNWINNLPTANDSISNGKDLTIGSADEPKSPATSEPTETAVATETTAPDAPPATETTAPEPPATEPGGDVVGDPLGIERCVTDPEAGPLLRAIDPTPDGLITTDELAGIAATMGTAELQSLVEQAVADGTVGYRYEGACNAAGDGDVSGPPPTDLPPAETPAPEDALTAAVRAAVPTGASANDGTVDRDGVVCLVLEEGAAAAIASVDADGDGTITLAEARAVAPDNAELQQAVDTAAARGITGFRYQGCGAPAVAMTPPATATTEPAPASAPVAGAGAPPPASGEEAAMISGSDGDAVNCRADANVESAVVARLPEGMTVALNGPAIGGWQPVICDGQPGYVATAFLATASTQVGTAATPAAGDPEPVAIQSADGGAPVDATQPPAADASATGTTMAPPDATAAMPTGTEAAQATTGEQQPGAATVEQPPAAAQPSPLAVASATDSEQSAAATDAIDGDPATSWSVVPQRSPRQVELTLDLGQPQPVGRLDLELASGATLPPAEMWLSMDGATWWNVASFALALATPNPDGAYTVPLGYTARFVRLVVPSVDVAAAPEIGGIAEVILWPADGETTSLETLGAPVTPAPVAATETPDGSEVQGTETPDGSEVQGTETPAADGQAAPIGDDPVPGEGGSDPPQVIEAEPAG